MYSFLQPPTSPQKPLKTSSPKKRNDMLSPIKTPKTPGSDGRSKYNLSFKYSQNEHKKTNTFLKRKGVVKIIKK